MSELIKILVVDDEAIGRQLLEAILFSEGYELIFGKDGEEAIVSAGKNFPDIILCDVMMPNMDGFEVCRHIRRNPKTAHIPIFLITALDDRDSRIRGIDAGADDYISKPLDRLEIVAKIKNLSTQILSRKNNQTNPEQISFLEAENEIDPNLLEGLVQQILLFDPGPKKSNIVRLQPILQSNHVYIENHLECGSYYLLASNNLTGQNACLANCLLTTIFKSIATSDKIYPTQLLGKVVEKFQGIAKDKNIKDFQQSGITMLLIFHETNADNIVASGIHQTLFASNTYSSPAGLSNGISFMPYYLLGNQDLSIPKQEITYLFSANVFNLLNQQELVTFLNEKLNNPTSIDFSAIINEKFKDKPDIVAVNLTS